MTSSTRPDWLARILAAPGFLLPTLTYLALAVAPGLWSELARGQMIAQFFIIELAAGFLVGALCKLIAESKPWVINVGRWAVLVSAVAGAGVIAWMTQSLGMAALVGIPVLPRVIETFRRMPGLAPGDESLCTDGILSLAGAVVIGLAYVTWLAVMADGSPNPPSRPPPISLTASVMAAHYLLLAYATGKPRPVGVKA